MIDGARDWVIDGALMVMIEWLMVLVTDDDWVIDGARVLLVFVWVLWKFYFTQTYRRGREKKEGEKRKSIVSFMR